MPKEGCYCICLSVILIDYVSKMGKNYCPQVFLEKCKYIATETKMSQIINDELEFSSDEPNYSDDKKTDKG